MTRSVDLVIVGANPAAIDATIEAVHQGLRVLVVTRATRAGGVRRLRRALRSFQAAATPALLIATGAEVACVDGVRATEAVVLRDLRTGRLTGFNAARLRRFSDQLQESASAGCGDKS
jgi:hypothetical protein